MLSEMLSYEFVRRALVAGLFLAVASALIGVPLVLRRKSMLGDGLSHVSFGAVAIALFLGILPTYFAIIVAVMAALILLSFDKKNKSESMIAVMSSSALAIGMLFLSKVNNGSIDPNSYLFGSILTLTRADMVISVVVSMLVVLLYLLFYKQIFAISFDEEFASAVGIKVKMYDTVLAILCSVIIVLGMKLTGSLLISALIVFPCLSAMKIAKSFNAVIVCTIVLSIVSFIFGFISSYILALPTGPTIALSELIFFILSSIIARIK